MLKSRDLNLNQFANFPRFGTFHEQVAFGVNQCRKNRGAAESVEAHFMFSGVRVTLNEDSHPDVLWEAAQAASKPGCERAIGP